MDYLIRASTSRRLRVVARAVCTVLFGVVALLPTHNAQAQAGTRRASPASTAAKRDSIARAKTRKAAETKRAAALADGGPAHGVSVGASSAGLGFGVGPVLGVVWRFAAPTPSLRLRADLLGSHYSQTASAAAGGAAITQSSSLTHLGASLLGELQLSPRRNLRPYLLAGAGVFRFQASGPSGSNGTIASGVFTSTTDLAGIAGLGLQINPRVYIEARFLTVGDFHALPFTAGVRF